MQYSVCHRVNLSFESHKACRRRLKNLTTNHVTSLPGKILRVQPPPSRRLRPHVASALTSLPPVDRVSRRRSLHFSLGGVSIASMRVESATACSQPYSAASFASSHLLELSRELFPCSVVSHCSPLVL